MLITLLTPLVLATAPMAVTVPETQYSHATQGAAVETTTNFTAGGTRTYDASGKPFDNDND